MSSLIPGNNYHIFISYRQKDNLPSPPAGGYGRQGSNPWDIRSHNEKFYIRAITDGELGIGESYMDGWWDAEQPDEFIFRVLRSMAREKIKTGVPVLFGILKARIFNLQSKQRAFIVGEKHYDLGNDLFQNMLDKRMNYSCAYWKDADNLDQAQQNKLELICRKLYLKHGMRILDIGCGWSAFGKYTAEKYHAEFTGITVSKEQVELGSKLCEGLPLKTVLMDYRDMREKFDRIVSIGMIPSVAQLGKAMENLFIMEDWHNFGSEYDKTLMAWNKNFDANREVLKDRYPERFFRMWTYFLLSSAGFFCARNVNQLWQIVLSKSRLAGGYHSVR